MSRAIRAVTVDLDDTLFPQTDWLEGAWQAVAVAAGRHGVDPDRLRAALRAVAAEGSDRGRIIDRALAEAGIELDVAPLVEAFSAHAPARLHCYQGVPQALARLRRHVPVAVVTDGNPAIQRAKLRALGLDGAVDAVVISDELGGRAVRKPHPAAFLRALDLLGVPAQAGVHIGDRPGKDLAGAAAVGMRAVRVRTGEYADDDGSGSPDAWRTVPSFVQAVDAVLAAVEPVRGNTMEEIGVSGHGPVSGTLGDRFRFTARRGRGRPGDPIPDRRVL